MKLRFLAPSAGVAEVRTTGSSLRPLVKTLKWWGSTWDPTLGSNQSIMSIDLITDLVQKVENYHVGLKGQVWG